MALERRRVRPALSPALTELARQLQAETPGFVPLKPGEHRTIDDYTVNHYWDGPKRKAKSRNGAWEAFGIITKLRRYLGRP